MRNLLCAISAAVAAWVAAAWLCAFCWWNYESVFSGFKQFFHRYYRSVRYRRKGCEVWVSAVRLTAFVRKPVLYRHKAVRRPRLPPLVLVVVTATEKGLDVGEMGWLPFFFLFFFFIRLVPWCSSVNQWRSLSFQGKKKYGVRLQLSSFSKPAVTSLPLGFFLKIKFNIYYSCKALKYESICSCFCDWHPRLLLSCRFLLSCHLRRGAHSGPLPWDTMRTPSPKIEVSSSPSNPSALPGICRFHTLTDHPHTPSERWSALCWRMLLVVFVKHCREIA